MGTWFDSLAVKGAAHDEVTERLTAWAELRGLRRDPRPLFECTDREMAFHVVSNDAWTIVLPSRDDETAQLVRRLAPLGRPMLRLWCASSDAWGHVLLEDGVPTVEFSDLGPYERDDELSDEPPTDPRQGDPRRLCQVLGLDGRVREIEKVQGSKPVFREASARRFCELLGIGPAASRHAYMDSDEAPPAGWRAEHVVFGPDEGETNFDLHDATAWPARPTRRQRERQVPPELEEAMRRRMQWMRLLMAPIGLALRAIFAVARLLPQRWIARAAGIDETTEELELRPSCRIDGVWFVNPEHGVRVAAPAGAHVLPRLDGSTVVHAEIAGAALVIRAVRFEDLRDEGAGLEIVEDDLLEIAGRKARRRVVRLPVHRRPDDAEPSRDVLLIAVQAPRAVYLFAHGAAGLDTQRRVLMDAVTSFQVEE